MEKQKRPSLPTTGLKKHRKLGSNAIKNEAHTEAVHLTAGESSPFQSTAFSPVAHLMQGQRFRHAYGI